MFEVGAQCLPSEPFCTHAAGKARESAGSGKGCARMGTSIPDWQRAACPQLLRELHRADQRGPLCSCSFSSQMLSICTNICTFCQSDSIITTYSIFELLEYFLHYFMLRWGNVLGGRWGSSSTWGALLLCFPKGYLDCWESCLIPNPVTCRWGNCLSQAWMAGKS